MVLRNPNIQERLLSRNKVIAVFEKKKRKLKEKKKIKRISKTKALRKVSRFFNKRVI